MNEIERFQAEVRDNIAGLRADADVQALSRIWVREIARYRYAYNFSWMGRPAIQFPQDMIGVQELVWRIRPDLIVETGIAHGGSLVYSASLLQLLGGDGIVVGVLTAAGRMDEPAMRRLLAAGGGGSSWNAATSSAACPPQLPPARGPRRPSRPPPSTRSPACRGQ